MTSADAYLDVLRSSVGRLRALIDPMDDEQIAESAYPAEWSIADVASHIGSSAVIFSRRLDDALAGQKMPDEFAPAVWDEWNAKSDRAKVTDGLAADQALAEQLGSVTGDERQSTRFVIGPLDVDFAEYVRLRVAEHVVHTWDVEVTSDPAATLAPDGTAVLIDHLDLIARFTARPTGESRTLVIDTTEPDRRFTIALSPEGVTFTRDKAADTSDTDLSLPSEAFIRLLYGRLDPAHTPGHGDESALDTLRRVYPGP
jgi:uncharacterized protein (TIGR03083 family)